MSGEYSDLQVRDVMNSPPVTALPIISVREAAKKMLDNKVGSLIIVNERNTLLGIVTKTDIIREVVARGLDPDTVRIGDIMTKNPYFVYTDDAVEKAAEIMGSHNIGHLPVLDPDSQKPVGMLSKTDIVKLAPSYISVIYSLRSEIDRRERLREL
ncbi:MAG: CBS domain-containing protein [Aeropyrum sp.]|nr:CBS domain-containing protein [Aeropyrum sp.]MCE4616474.1 CBS domain-containing protein [Aeropyrum sp.]